MLAVPDGAAEPPREGRATSLERAATPCWDRLGGEGAVVAVRPVPAGLTPGTEVGLPTLLGVRLAAVPARGRIEAAGAGVDLAADDGAWRLDAHPAHPLSAAAVAAVGAALADVGARVLALGGHRMLLVGPAAWGDAPPGPHQVDGPLAAVATGGWRELAERATTALAGVDVDAQAWPWGRVGAPDELTDAAPSTRRTVWMVSGGGAGPGLARALGVELVGDDPADAGAVVADAPDGALVVVHDPRPDAAGHERDAEAKARALAAFDAEVLAPAAASAARRDATLLACPDHGCDPATGGHTDEPVPAVVRGATVAAGPTRTATERGVAGLAPVAGYRLLDHVARGALAAGGSGSPRRGAA